MDIPTDDILITIALALLVPLFRPFVDNDDLARKAAWAQVQRVGIGPMTDPFTLVQTIGFGMAAATTLTQAASPDLDIDTRMKLNRAANSFSRTEERQRRLLRDQARRQPPPAPPTEEEAAAIEADKTKQIRIARKLGGMIQAEAQALRQRHPEGTQSTARTPVTERLEKLHTATGYVTVAEECATDPESYTGGCQKEANLRAKMACVVAYEILTGKSIDVDVPFDLEALLEQGKPSRPPSGSRRPDRDFHRSAPDLEIPPRAAA